MPRPMPVQKKKTSIAVPVISQGMAIGGSRSVRSSDRPRNRRRSSAKAASAPSAGAIAEVAQAITRLLRVAESSGPFFARTENQRSDGSIGRGYKSESLEALAQMAGRARARSGRLRPCADQAGEQPRRRGKDDQHDREHRERQGCAERPIER